MGREEEKRGWEESGPPPGPSPAAPAWLSDPEEREEKKKILIYNHKNIPFICYITDAMPGLKM